jgi:molybdate transport repressor ModE-like protein
MIRIDIRPVWRFRNSSGAEKEFDFTVIAFLERLEQTAKLTQAAEGAEISYRHAWNLVSEWEKFFGKPLAQKVRGRGTRITAFGRRLLWAARRAQARLAPELDNLSSDFARSVNESLSESLSTLHVHASHDFAVGALRDLCAGTSSIDVQYKGSFDALAALRRGECDVAGFHVPEGRMGELMTRRYEEGLPLDEYRLISFVTRTQGFIVLQGNPKGIGSVADLAREDVVMVNRQRGSGTRALLEFMISADGLDRARMRGYDTEEITHAAVASLIAGHQADAGFGVQAAAALYRLGFVPICKERYYLACRADEVDSPAITGLVAVLKGAEFHARVAELAGYAAPDAGRLLASFKPRSRAASRT